MNRQELTNLINTSEDAVKTAVTTLFKAQEELEQQVKGTVVRNGKGFMKCDAKPMTEVAEKVLAGQALTEDDLAACRKLSKKGGVPRLARYFRQLTESGAFAS